MRKPIIIFCAVLCILVLSVGGHAATCTQYNAVIVGKVTGPYTVATVRTNEIALVRDQGFATHQIEFVIAPSPNMQNQAVQPGLILLMTNSAFSGNSNIAAARMDMGGIEPLGNAVFGFRLDTLAALNAPTNAFVALGDSRQGAVAAPALVMRAAQGDAQIAFPDQNTVLGAIDILGLAIPGNPGFSAQYQARFQGNLAARNAC